MKKTIARIVNCIWPLIAVGFVWLVLFAAELYDGKDVNFALINALFGMALIAGVFSCLIALAFIYVWAMDNK